nr:hypothetical protein Q903MT_gene240 [Picea sitchensis]
MVKRYLSLYGGNNPNECPFSPIHLAMNGGSGLCPSRGGFANASLMLLAFFF